MTVAYVLSMKSGLPSFNRDELLELENHTIPFILYATKIGAGPYTPNRDWKVRGPNPADTLIGLFGFFTRYPRRFGRALSETVREFLWAEFLVAAAFAWDMRRHGVTWIHAHFGDRKVLVARLASILLACPYSVTIHAHELTSMYQRRARSRALRESVRVFTVADFNRESLIRDWALSPSKVVTNRLILGRDHQRADRRAKMLVVANFVEKKGYDVLVQALREIPASEITVWIVGGGELDVEALAKTAEVMDRVVFLGCVAPEMLSILLDACDFFCLPSRTSSTGAREGFPIAIAEAMAHGKPIVASKHAGIPEVVSEILVPEGDPRALASGIREMLDRRQQWPAMGQRNRSIALKYFSPDNIEALVQTFRTRG